MTISVALEVRVAGNGAHRHTALQLQDIAHRTTRVKRPQSNSIVSMRFHRTLLDEHFRVEGHKTWFETVEEMQAVLDECPIV